MTDPRGRRRGLIERRGTVSVSQALLVLAIFLLWEGVVQAGWASQRKFGQPSHIWFHFRESLSSGELWRHLKITLYEEVMGFVLGTVGGTAIGLSLWWSRTLARILEPFVVIFNGIPKIALAPPMIIWFGIYETSKIVLAASICFVVAWLSAYSGTQTVDRDLLDMVRAVGGTRWQAFTRVVIPSAFPWILSALKISIGFALVGAVVGEFVASNHGLGYLTVQAGMLFQMSRLWMVVLVTVLVAALQYYLVLWLERHLFRWAGEERVRGMA